MLIVHVGLGKTATTTLQGYVFSQVPQLRENFIYNDKRILNVARKNHLFGASSSEVSEVKEFLSMYDHLISFESLVNWNPRFWEEAADRNLEIFGKDAKIVITVREPLSYMKSIYQQRIHEGNIKRPEHFFVNKETYDKLAYQIPSWKMDYFDVDSFDLKRLKAIYTLRFNSVDIVPMEDINKLKFLTDKIDFSESEINYLKRAFRQAPRVNKAYSKTAMALVFKREKLLNKIGLRSCGSNDRMLIGLLNRMETIPMNRYVNCEIQQMPFKELSLYKKVLELPYRTFRRLKMLFKWRVFVKNLDKIIPYKKYELPNYLYLNNELIKSNRAFIEEYKVRDK